MIGTGTNPALLIARAVLTRPARFPLPGNASCTITGVYVEGVSSGGFLATKD